MVLVWYINWFDCWSCIPRSCLFSNTIMSQNHLIIWPTVKSNWRINFKSRYLQLQCYSLLGQKYNQGGFWTANVMIIRIHFKFLITWLFLGVNISTVFEGDLVPALNKPPYTLDSTARYSYQTPAVKTELSEDLSRRFGCNKNNYKPAVGAGRGHIWGKIVDTNHLLWNITYLFLPEDFQLPQN